MRRMDDVTSLADLREGVDVPAFGVEMTLEEARKYNVGDLDVQGIFEELLDELIDEAQGQVYMKNSDTSFVVIKIVR